MILPEERTNSKSRFHFLTDVTALELLCSPEAVSRLESAVASLNVRDQRNFLRGYRLAVATPLHGLLWFVVDHPEMLGLQRDEGLYNWLHHRSPERGESLLSAVSDTTSDLGLLCYVFDDLEAALHRADGGLANTVAAIQKCRVVAAHFAEFLAGTEIVSLNDGEEFPPSKIMLRMSVAERVLDYVGCDPSIVRLARELVWRSGEEFHPVDDRFILNAETHLDRVALFPFATVIPEKWGTGFWFGCDLVIKLSGVTLPSDGDFDFAPRYWQRWFDEIRTFARSIDQSGEWPSGKCGLTELSQSNVRELLEHCEVNMDAVSSKRRLAAILGPDRVRLITSAGATDAIELEVMLRGAIAAHGDSKVQVLILTHSVASDEREWVSIAFRLPIHGIVSNASKWFLFYKMYHAGRVFETDVARAAAAVERLLSQFKDSLEVEEISGLDSEDFLPLCVLPAFREMRELSLKAVETNVDLRSGNSELLAGFWLVSQGYRNVKVAFKRASLGKFEYDAIGIKDGHCKVVEVKGGATVDRELQKEIHRFANKIEDLRGRMPDLTKALGCESDVENVSGLFIFLGNLDNFKPIVTSIPLWDYDDFVGALKKADLPNKIVSLLDKEHIIRQIRLGDFPNDPLCVGL